MADFRCPKCDKKLFEYYGKISYGYMIKECKKCGAKYVDPRIMEMALTGIPARDFNINSYIFVIAIGIFMIYFFHHENGTCTTS